MLNNLMTNVLAGVGLAYWLVVKTEQPQCTYYFGPFLSPKEAREKQKGYLADLEAEGAEGITTEVTQCRPPQHLTVEAA
ncbi:DUF1816 domain-containing protein [Synechococcus sp. PCC 7336]|uniref:DUF1816 domain-containing protein n=1 Tax=Synechococcus sp. PCC 7336 TaxID=195250 RepID=UPI000360D3CB|nr:DUF1816 domain-containing protein [Synechococcus sp. PCC 7336]